MTTLSSLLAKAEYNVKRKEQLEQEIRSLVQSLTDTTQLCSDHVEAQRLLASIEEKNTADTLAFVTNIINKALTQIFQGDGRKVTLSKDFYQGRYAHINVQLQTKGGAVRDLDLQTGQGVKEVIAFLFTVCLIAVSGSRRLLIMDELLSGLHPKAKTVIFELMGFFVDDGFQFLMVEYSADNYQGNSFGKIYQVIPEDGVSRVELIPNGEYAA